MKHAILCGSAPDGFTQKKINEMHDFLTGTADGFWAEKEITIFPNGVNEEMLNFMFERFKADNVGQILLYICTLSPASDSDKTVWLGGEEVKKSVIERLSVDVDCQVIFDSCGEMVGEEEMEEEVS